MSEDEKQPKEARGRDLASWLSGRKTEVERWVEESCQRAVAGARAVAAEEIRGLSRRVERMHGLLDQLERLVDAPAPSDGAKGGGHSSPGTAQ